LSDQSSLAGGQSALRLLLSNAKAKIRRQSDDRGDWWHPDRFGHVPAPLLLDALRWNRSGKVPPIAGCAARQAVLAVFEEALEKAVKVPEEGFEIKPALKDGPCGSRGADMAASGWADGRKRKTKPGPKRGIIARFREADAALFPEIEALVMERQMSVTSATKYLAEQGRIAGSSTPPSQARRLRWSYSTHMNSFRLSD
jgi:hypothetical protein